MFGRMCSSTKILGSRGARFTRNFSAEAAEKQAPISSWMKLKNFVSGNRQAIMNCIGAYFVLSYSIHNYRVQQAWDEREAKLKGVENELSRIKTGLTGQKWAAEVEEKILSNRQKSMGWGSSSAPVTEKGSTLVEAISELVQYAPPTSEDIVREHMTKGSAVGDKGKVRDDGSTAALAAIFASDSGKKTSAGPKMV